VAIRTAAAAAWPNGLIPGVTVWIGSSAAPRPAGRWGVVARPEFWTDTDPPADADLVLAQIPAQADPEAVMKRVRALT
jgi:hypothetical protein